jgi:hypothetical protein
VRTILRLFPDRGLVVTALTNTSHDAVFEVADRLAAAVLPEFARRLERDRAREDGEGENGEDGEDAAFSPPADLVGTWSGRLVTWEASLPARLDVQADGDVRLELEGQLVALVNGVELENGFLTGRAELRGWAAAQTRERPVHYALSSYLELVKD